MFVKYSREDIELIKLAYFKKKESVSSKHQSHPILDKLHEHVRIFRKLEKQDIAKIVEDVKVGNYKKGQKIYDVGNLEARYYFVVRGCIKIMLKDMSGAVREARSTQTFGEKYAMLHQPRPYMAVASSESATVLSFKVPSQIPESFGLIFAQFYKNVATELAIRDKHND
jgi:signal-transduction protein with cAMP-binding, CBS, and nucleotidyltransferase domain